MPIAFKQVSYEYSPGTPFAYGALNGVDVEITEGKVTAIIGATGSGKSTLIQHLNALLLPSKGEVEVLDRTIVAGVKPKQLKSLRQNVGLVFQFPEYQLFEETILKDIIFGPINFGVEPQEAELRSLHALNVVGLDETYAEKSPLDLSGGQKRRVAIAGILAIDPYVLVLDEPTAGLDPQGSKSMMNLFMTMNRKYGKTVLIVTHDMEHVLTYCDEVVVVDKGKVILKSDVRSFFKDESLLDELNICPPKVVDMRRQLQKAGMKLPDDIFDIESLAMAIAKEVTGHE
jgi:energy-coupling factor transport system ATP-binding protein